MLPRKCVTKGCDVTPNGKSRLCVRCLRAENGDLLEREYALGRTADEDETPDVYDVLTGRRRNPDVR